MRRKDNKKLFLKRKKSRSIKYTRDEEIYYADAELYDNIDHICNQRPIIKRKCRVFDIENLIAALSYHYLSYNNIIDMDVQGDIERLDVEYDYNLCYYTFSEMVFSLDAQREDERIKIYYPSNMVLNSIKYNYTCMEDIDDILQMLYPIDNYTRDSYTFQAYSNSYDNNSSLYNQYTRGIYKLQQYRHLAIELCINYLKQEYSSADCGVEKFLSDTLYSCKCGCKATNIRILLKTIFKKKFLHSKDIDVSHTSRMQKSIRNIDCLDVLSSKYFEYSNRSFRSLIDIYKNFEYVRLQLPFLDSYIVNYLSDQPECNNNKKFYREAIDNCPIYDVGYGIYLYSKQLVDFKTLYTGRELYYMTLTIINRYKTVVNKRRLYTYRVCKRYNIDVKNIDIRCGCKNRLKTGDPCIHILSLLPDNIFVVLDSIR